jgi:hypothetical protein
MAFETLVASNYYDDALYCTALFVLLRLYHDLVQGFSTHYGTKLAIKFCYMYVLYLSLWLLHGPWIE